LIFIFYWGILYKADLLKANVPGRPIFSSYFYYHKIAIHSFSAITAAINLIISVGVFIPGHAIYQLYIVVLYLPFNCFGTWYNGEPLYSFMDWTSIKSVIIGLGVFFVSLVIQ